MVDWNKEISFRRKAKPKAAPEAEPQAAADAVPVPEPEEPTQVVATAPAAAEPIPAAEERVVELDLDATAVALPADAAPSFELAEAVAAAAEAHAAERSVDPAPTADFAEEPPIVSADEHEPVAAPPAAEKASRRVKGLSFRRNKAEKAPKTSRRSRGFKAQTVVGLKVGASQVAAAHVVNNGSSELVQVARQPLEHGIVVGGELRDADGLAAALKDLFAKSKLPRRGVRLGISNNRVGVRLLEIDGMQDAQQLKNAIRFRAQEALPIPIDEAVLDYVIVDESAAEDGTKTYKVVLVVAYRDLVDRYVAACKKAGLKLMGIDLEAFALLRALGVEGDAGDTGLVVVSIGHDRSTFAVSDGRVCEFTRVLDWGGFSLNVAIARALQLAPSEAEPIKLGLSLSDATVVPEGLSPQQSDAVRDAVRKQLEAFARDLVSSLRFYQNQPGSLGIREIVVTGGTTELPGLAAELERLIGVPVRVGDPLARVKVGKKVARSEQLGSLTAAIGLGMEI